MLDLIQFLVIKKLETYTFGKNASLANLKTNIWNIVIDVNNLSSITNIHKVMSVIITSRKHTYIIWTPLNPTFIP